MATLEAIVDIDGWLTYGQMDGLEELATQGGVSSPVSGISVPPPTAVPSQPPKAESKQVPRLGIARHPQSLPSQCM